MHFDWVNKKKIDTLNWFCSENIPSLFGESKPLIKFVCNKKVFKIKQRKKNVLITYISSRRRQIMWEFPIDIELMSPDLQELFLLFLEPVDSYLGQENTPNTCVKALSRKSKVDCASLERWRKSSKHSPDFRNI